MMRSILLGVLFIQSLILFAQEKPYLVVLSMDGFRWDYTDKASTPTFDSIAANGVKAESLQPSFPSLTFPNHFSMATGLYPDHHGIVHNSFYDPALDRYYKIGDRKAVEDGVFYRGEPIWNISEKQGITAASCFWVGSEAPVNGNQPTYWKRYDHEMPFGDRIDTVIAWLSLPEPQRPHLVMFYFHEPDSKGHQFGPDSKEIEETVVELDSLAGVLCRKLNTLPIAAEINLIITSDHGMGATSPARPVKVYQYIKSKWFTKIQGYNPVACFQFKPEHETRAMASLKKIPHTQAWKTTEIPERLHYGSNPRTLDAILVADSGYALKMDRKGWIGKGAHGYDPENRDMHAIFYAIGPAFKKAYTQPTFENVDLVPLFGKILGLELAPTDGILQRVEGVLIEE